MHLGRRALLAGLLGLAAAPALAQGLGFGLGMQDVVVRAGGGGAPLDAFTQPSGAYSFRKLRSTYAGPAVRLRRASDNAETDINFIGCTGFTGCPWDVAAASAHCNATTCTLVTWYDQSGNARHLTQATAANQPQLIFSCQGALPCARVTAATQILVSAGTLTPATGLASINGVARRNGSFTATCIVLQIAGGTGNRMGFRNAASSMGVFAGGGFVAVAAADSAPHAATGITNAAASSMSVDGTAPVTGTATLSVTAGALSMFGCAGPQDNMEGVIWDNYATTTAERLALETNQKSFWGF